MVPHQNETIISDVFSRVQGRGEGGGEELSLGWGRGVFSIDERWCSSDVGVLRQKCLSTVAVHSDCRTGSRRAR